MRKTSRQAWRVVGGGIGAVTLFGLGHVATRWLRYGHVPKRKGPPTLLDRFLPKFEVLERHHTRVAAPVDVTYAAARQMSLDESPVARAIFRGRELLMRAASTDGRRSAPLIDEVLSIGWGVLAQEPGREIVVGAVTQPWKSEVTFRALPPDEFASVNEPGMPRSRGPSARSPLDRIRHGSLPRRGWRPRTRKHGGVSAGTGRWSHRGCGSSAGKPCASLGRSRSIDTAPGEMRPSVPTSSWGSAGAAPGGPASDVGVRSGGVPAVA